MQEKNLWLGRLESDGPARLLLLHLAPLGARSASHFQNNAAATTWSRALPPDSPPSYQFASASSPARPLAARDFATLH